MKETAATVAAHTKPEKTLAFTASKYVHGMLFQPDITRNIEGARRIADTFNRQYLQARLAEFEEVHDNSAYGHSKRSIGKYLLHETMTHTDVDPRQHGST